MFLLRPSPRTSQLKERHPALQNEYQAFHSMIFYASIVGILALLDPDPLTAPNSMLIRSVSGVLNNTLYTAN